MDHYLEQYMDWLEVAYYDATEPPEVERICRCCDTVDTLTEQLNHATPDERPWIQDRIDALNASLDVIY